MIDLEGYHEGITADESFNMRMRNCRALMKEINKGLTQMKADQKTDKRSWGHSGSMSYIQEKLEEIHTFIWGDDE